MVMFPVVALVLSFFFEDLQITGNIVMGVMFVLLGNLFVLRTRQKTQSVLATISRPSRRPRHASQ